MSGAVEWPAVLKPFDPAEAISTGEASRIAGRSLQTIRRWIHTAHIGRKIAGQWRVSRWALAMVLAADRPALDAYLAGDRESELVLAHKNFGDGDQKDGRQTEHTQHSPQTGR